MNSQKIFITGPTGFIGKNLTEYLDERYKILTPSHKELELLNNENVENYFKNNNIDVIVHCAVTGGRRNQLHLNDILENNLAIFSNIVKNKKYFKKLIFLGSGAEYDKSQDIVNVRETDFGKNMPKDGYGLYKYKCSEYIEKSDDEIINLRLFGVYGKYEDYVTRFISNAICRCIFDLPIIIENKNVYFDYLYINDLVRIIEYFILQKPKYKFYNVGKGEKIDLLTIAGKVKKISGKNVEIIVKNKGLGQEYTCDVSRLKNEIKEFNFTSHDDAIRELYRWYQKNKKSIDLNKIK